MAPTPSRSSTTGIDFGDTNWLGNAPAGCASVQWYVPDCDSMNADVVGTLHLDGVDGHSGRIHVEFGSGSETVTKHSAIKTANDNGHDEWPVNLYSPSDMHVFEVKVCTELRDDSDPGDDFDTVSCKTFYRTDPHARDRTTTPRSGLPATNTRDGQPGAGTPIFQRANPTSPRSERSASAAPMLDAEVGATSMPSRAATLSESSDVAGRRSPSSGRSSRTSTRSDDDTASTRATSSAKRSARISPA